MCIYNIVYIYILDIYIYSIEETYTQYVKDMCILLNFQNIRGQGHILVHLPNTVHRWTYISYIYSVPYTNYYMQHDLCVCGICPIFKALATAFVRLRCPMFGVQAAVTIISICNQISSDILCRILLKSKGQQLQQLHLHHLPQVGLACLSSWRKRSGQLDSCVACVALRRSAQNKLQSPPTHANPCKRATINCQSVATTFNQVR